MSSDIIKFVFNNRIVEIDFSDERFHPSTTVLNYLRRKNERRGTKEGCSEGDCGACTVVIGEINEDNSLTYTPVDSCLLFLPAIHGKQLITVEDLAVKENNQTLLHPVQQAMVEHNGSQCGFCTPGIVMTLFALYKSMKQNTYDEAVQALSGNLCRCTGYEPIIKAAMEISEDPKPDKFSKNEKEVIELLKSIKAENNYPKINTSNQSYFLPNNLKEALAIKAQNPDAVVVNGATDTAIKQNKTFEFPKKLLDISAVNELNIIKKQEGGYTIGAGVRIEKLKSFAYENLQMLNTLLEVFASWQIRNVATIGGNLATASPVGDLIPMLYALKAEVELGNHEKTRWVTAEEFITGYRSTCLESDELLLNIFIPKPEKDTLIRSEKISVRRHLDISTLSIAMRLKTSEDNIVEEIILAYGGMAKTPKRALNTEKFFKGKPFTLENAKKAGDFIEKDFKPISDARAGKEYRMIAAKNLLLKMAIAGDSNRH